MNAADIMTRDVLTVAPDTPIKEAIRLMLDRHISGLPVVDENGLLAGIVTEGDLLRRAETGTKKHRPRWLDFVRGTAQRAEDYVHTHGRKVADVMTCDVVTVTEGTKLDVVVGLMERHHIKRVAVADKGRLHGVVSRADLLRALLNALPAGEAAPADDAALQSHVTAELSRHDWGDDGRVTVSVEDGTVHLEGIVFDMRERDAMRVAAENVPGVRRVTDRLEYIDPNIGVIGVP